MLFLVLDIALSKGGTEAVAESIYSVIGTQMQAGGQDHNTLIDRTIVDWYLPTAVTAIPFTIN